LIVPRSRPAASKLVCIQSTARSYIIHELITDTRRTHCRCLYKTYPSSPTGCSCSTNTPISSFGRAHRLQVESVFRLCLGFRVRKKNRFSRTDCKQGLTSLQCVAVLQCVGTVALYMNESCRLICSKKNIFSRRDCKQGLSCLVCFIERDVCCVK